MSGSLTYDSAGRGSRTHTLYPPDTKAFLYYSIPLEKPRIAGELRLRLTSGDDIASFESGSDLLRTNGQPWSRPVYSLSQNYPPLYEKLREDGLIPDDLHRILSTFPPKNPKYRASRFSYTLNDPFIVDFSAIWLTLHFITEKGAESLSFLKLFSDPRKTMRDIRPYTGAYTSHHLSILLY